MNAEPENETDAPKRRGRIPQSAWPHILERYRAGTTLSAIAREFDCTPSAISYIVRKAEAASGDTEAVTAPSAAAEAAPVQPEPIPAPAPLLEQVPAPAPVAAEAQRPASDNGRDLPRFEHRGEGPRPLRAEQPMRENRPLPGPQEVRQQGPQQFQGDPRPQQPVDASRAPGEFREPRGERGGEFRGDRQERPQRPQFQSGGQQRPPRDFQPAQGRPQENRSDRFGGNRFDRQGQAPVQDPRPPRPAPVPQSQGAETVERFNPDIDYVERPADAPYPYHQRQRNPARLEAAETPTIPAGERMETAGKACADAYRAWKSAPGEGGVQPLSEALHELRKVVARMEIEMSATRKEEQRALPTAGYRLNQSRRNRDAES